MPKLIAVTCAAGVQVWKRNSLISSLTGTIIYMVLVQPVFCWPGLKALPDSD
ncbi:MAG: AzlD domain-containing protein [Lachnospiraceae bacterium]|nr:AzlD domain-containing protein [Lachnospiraceae bacterium]